MLQAAVARDVAGALDPVEHVGAVAPGVGEVGAGDEVLRVGRRGGAELGVGRERREAVVGALAVEQAERRLGDRGASRPRRGAGFGHAAPAPTPSRRGASSRWRRSGAAAGRELARRARGATVVASPSRPSVELDGRRGPAPARPRGPRRDRRPRRSRRRRPRPSRQLQENDTPHARGDRPDTRAGLSEAPLSWTRVRPSSCPRPARRTRRRRPDRTGCPRRSGSRPPHPPPSTPPCRGARGRARRTRRRPRRAARRAGSPRRRARPGSRSPSQRSWCERAICSATPSTSEPPSASTRAPSTAWVLTTSNSSGSSRPGLSRIESGIAILPRSCSGAAWRTSHTIRSFCPRCRAIRAASAPTRWVCSGELSSRYSAASASRCRVSTRIASASRNAFRT